MKLQTIATVALAVGLMTQAQGELKWLDNFEEGKKAAAESGKALLVDFTGSDWCHWCIQLHDEVFSKPEFEAVSEDFVLVELDFPQAEDAITPEQRADNEELAEKFGIQGFPTVLLFDSEARPYARTGYQAGGPEAYLTHLSEISKPWKDLQSAEGEARKGALITFLKTLLGGDIASLYSQELAELKTLDPEDESGLLADIAMAEKLGDFEADVELSISAGEFDKVLALTDAFIAENKPEGEDKQHVLMAKVMVYVEQAEQEKAFAMLDDMAVLAPETELAVNLDGIKEEIKNHLETKKEMEEKAQELVPRQDREKQEPSVIEEAEAAETEGDEIQ